MISPLAYIHPDAKLGKDVIVEPFAYIAGKVEIGDNSWIGPHAVIYDGAFIGRNCKIHSGAVIAGTPQDLKFKGEESTVVIGDNNTIRECATINRGTAAKGVTTIGSDNLLMAYTHVGHDCTVGNHCVLVNRVSLGGEVVVDDWAILGGHVAVHQFCNIGAHSIVSGGTAVTKDIPPFVTAARNPTFFMGVNSIGLRRRGFTNERIHQIQEMCRILFQSGLSYSHGMDRIEAELPSSEDREMMLGFIRHSKRGILKANPNITGECE